MTSKSWQQWKMTSYLSYLLTNNIWNSLLKYSKDIVCKDNFGDFWPFLAHETYCILGKIFFNILWNFTIWIEASTCILKMILYIFIGWPGRTIKCQFSIEFSLSKSYDRPTSQHIPHNPFESISTSHVLKQSILPTANDESEPSTKSVIFPPSLSLLCSLHRLGS